MTDQHFKPSDWLAREQALDPERSFIVQAPAGSGKTELLIQRILVLLAHVQRPEEILAITFTRKAAGEMHARLMTALERARCDQPPDKPHERTTWQLARKALTNADNHDWHLLDNPNRLQVMTIDSFCAALTRRLPWMSSFGTQPAVNENPAEYYALAASRLLEQVEKNGPGSQSVRRLLRHLDNQLWTLRDMLVDMLGKRDQWFRHVLTDDPEKARDVLEEALRDHVHKALLAAYHALGADLRQELSELCRYASGNLADNDQHDLAEQLCRLGNLQEPKHDDLPAWQAMLELLLTQGDKVRSSVNRNQGFPPGDRDCAHMKQRMQDALRLLADNPVKHDPLVNLRYLPRSSYADPEWRILKALTVLLPLAVMELQQVFREQGAVDFIEIAGAARAALGNASAPEDLLLQLDSRLGHILVDEFQDTSYGQFVLLEQLTSGWEQGDGRTLFVVGDPMQSIYRFREADVGLYLRARRTGLNNVSLEPLTLEANFRSQAGIVNWVNTTFRALFPNEPDESTGAVPYVTATAVKPEDPTQAVTLHAYRNRQDELEAARIVDQVQRSSQDFPNGTVAVLVRSRTHLEEIVRAFKQSGLKFQAQDLDPLGQRAVIQDLRALTRALLHPADRISWLATLRAPWCGLSLDDLLQVCEESPYDNVWDLLARPKSQAGLFDGLSEDATRRLDVFREVMDRFLAKKGRVTLRRLVESCWFSLNGPACISPSDYQDAERFFELLEELDDGGDLVRLEALDERLEKLYAASDSEAGPNLQVMTIHKAKGLEFDVVILPGLGRTTPAGQRALLRWQEMPDSHLLLAPIPALYGQGEGATYQAIGRLMRTRDDHETLRLLYVAATRAKSRLHLLGHVKERADGDFSPEKKSLLDAAWAVLHESFCDHLYEGEAVGERPRQAGQAVRRLPTGWSPPALAPTAHQENLQVRKATEKSGLPMDTRLSLSLRTEEGRMIGTVTHGWLERIAKEGLAEWPLERIELIDDQVRRQLQNAGVPGKRLKECCETVLAALRTSLQSERGRWILDNHQEAFSEYAVNGIYQDSLVHAVIDRTFVDADNIRWIIDFKTSSPKNGQTHLQFFAQEVERYQLQMEAYQGLFRQLEPGRDVRAAIYFPAIDGWQVYP